MEPRRAAVCLSLTETTLKANRAHIEAQRPFVDAIEFRADHLSPYEFRALGNFVKAAALPSTLAMRRATDGGQFHGEERERVHALRTALEGPWDAIELDEGLQAPELEAEARRRGIRIIRSFYATAGVPADLAARLRRLARAPDELPKAIVAPQSTADLVRLLDAFRELRDLPKILAGSGPFGFATVVLPTLLGSAATYAQAGVRSATPGSVDPETLVRIYRVREQSETTRVFAVVGNPVMHSRSPWIHNPGFAALGIDAVYLPLLVDRIEDFFAVAGRLEIGGASVTIPHKEAVLPFLASRDADVERLGACNTLVASERGWEGSNSDLTGFIVPLSRVLGPGWKESIRSLKVLVVGAGGAARSVVGALVAHGSIPTVANRDLARARRVADEFGAHRIDLDAKSIGQGYDVIVQATSVGMHPHENADPLAFYDFRGTEIVYELVYAPRQTLLLRRAEAAGCRTIGGIEMLLEQAYVQFKRFTGRTYPRGVALVGR